MAKLINKRFEGNIYETHVDSEYELLHKLLKKRQEEIRKLKLKIEELESKLKEKLS